MNDTPLEDEVHDALHRTADTLHRTPLTVGDVRGRARRIRRRRSVAAGAVVAAALAIVVPVGLNLAGSPRSDGVQPASQSPPPEVTGTVRVDPRSAPTSDSLAVSLVDVDAPSLIADGSVTDLPDSYEQLTPYLDGWLGLANTEGAISLRRLDADFAVVDEIAATTSRLSISADGSRIAWAELDNVDGWSVVDVAADGSRDERRTPLPDLTADSTLDVVGFASDTDVVVMQSDYSDGTVTTLRVDGSSVVPVPGLVRPWSSSSAIGVVAGVIRVKKDLSSCSAVLDAEAGTTAPVWKTCDHTLAAFSPDGAYVVGLAPYLDGYGSPTLAILDAATGETVVDYELIGPRRGVLGINDRMVWEDADSLVVTVVSGDGQYVLRVNTDGTVERITAPGTELEKDRVSLELATG